MRYYLFAFLLIVTDQLTKLLVRMHMEVGESINLLGEFFRLTHIQNKGAAFSTFSEHRFLLVVVPVMVILVAMVMLHRAKDAHWTFYTSWSMIIAGGIGNLIDRIAFGQVTDMLDFSIFPPVFNVADIGVTVGCGLFVIYILLEDKWKKHDGM